MKQDHEQSSEIVHSVQCPRLTRPGIEVIQ